jgi:hypothetical protein
MSNYIKQKIEVGLRKYAQVSSRRAISKNKNLWEKLQHYISTTNSTGCGDIDYYYSCTAKLKNINRRKYWNAEQA